MDKNINLDEVLEGHSHWINQDIDGWGKMRANLSHANLIGADLSSADLSSANLSYADLRGANLRGANLRGANLRGADLRGADLSHANLIGADLSSADLSSADLSYADLSYANLRGANLIGADLSSADLSSADLSYANLRSADLRGANLRGANLSSADLSGAGGLISPINFIANTFESNSEGIICYKTFGGSYEAPDIWCIEPRSIITETVNPNRTTECGSGINVAPLEWVKNNYSGDIWKCLIRWEWAIGIVVPYNTDGKIRCEKLELLEIVER